MNPTKITIRRFLGRGSAVVAAAAIVAALVFAMIRPSQDRDWVHEHARLPWAEFEDDLVRIHDVRDFRHGADGAVTRRYEDRIYDLRWLDTLWYVLAVFDGEGWRGPAHGMFSFGFADGEYVVISIEARKEVGETYSWWRGLFKAYELIYVVGDERDLVLTRAVYRPDVVYMFPVAAAPQKIRDLLVSMLAKANALHREPEFYNTLTDNCTSRLRDHVNAIAPGRIPPSWKVALPGYSDELMESLGLLGSDLPLAEARRLYMINDRARRHARAADFSRAIRRAAE
ncbi:DUF4105 domain-containing protein [bacterium]|nr:DUF4105 domain-containing protein [bacterium]MBU1071984.1 DUF4105 domain-containing protein [bacterium]MBU1674286.1 DUF4105 domain-containing protein [bacterium]